MEYDDSKLPTPIRDIVIETRVDVKHIREAMDAITACIKEHDERLRRIEIDGSKLTQENCGNLVKLQVRVSRLETTVSIDDLPKEKTVDEKITAHEQRFVDSVYYKVGIIAGIVFAFLAFVKSYFQSP